MILKYIVDIVSTRFIFRKQKYTETEFFLE